MRFLIHPLEILDGWPEVFAACISGPEARICPTRIEIDDNVLSCYRDGTESGKLQVVWPVEGFGRPVVTTTSLMERDEPYLLAVELVRGKIAQNCDQAGAWEIAGMVLPDEFARLQKQSFQLFSQAVSIQDDPEKSSDLARDALTQSCKAAEALVKSYTDQRLAVRRQRFPQLPASLGCSVGHGIPDDSWNEKFCEAFNAAAVPVEWKNIESVEGETVWEVNDEQVEWCHKHRLLMYGGPLLDFSPNGLPEWLWQWDKDSANVQSFVNNFVETAISRYVGRIRHWEIAARPNTGGALAWNEENRLTLVANMLEVARHVDEETQLTIRVDLPWGDYQARGQHRLSPIQFVDALVRSGSGLSGVNLEIGVGYRPQGTTSRGLLDFSGLIDRWSTLGIALHVTLAFPSSTAADPAAKSDLEVGDAHWKNDWSESAQAEWIDLYLPLLMAKESIVGIYWTHFSDRTGHYFPNAGLLRADESPKPALETIVKYRREYWAPHGELASGS